MAERGRNQDRQQQEREDTERTERRHFARRHPRSWGHDEMRIELVKRRLQEALDCLTCVEDSEIVDEAEVVATVEAKKVARAFELIDGLDVHLPEVMAWSVGYEAFSERHRSTYFGCTTEEQAIEIAAAMNEKEGISKDEFTVKRCPCRVIDMVTTEFTGADI